MVGRLWKFHFLSFIDCIEFLPGLMKNCHLYNIESSQLGTDEVLHLFQSSITYFNKFYNFHQGDPDISYYFTAGNYCAWDHFLLHPPTHEWFLCVCIQAPWWTLTSSISLSVDSCRLSGQMVSANNKSYFPFSLLLLPYFHLHSFLSD